VPATVPAVVCFVPRYGTGCQKVLFIGLIRGTSWEPLVSVTASGIACSVLRSATGWTVRASNPGGGEASMPVQSDPGAPIPPPEQ
jgi:hypothetical protein